MFPANCPHILLAAFFFYAFIYKSPVKAQNETLNIAIISDHIIAELNQMIIITCVASGGISNSINISWVKDGNIVRKGEEHCLADREIEQGHYRLRQSFLQISSLSCTDVGEYICLATDGVNNVTSSVNIRTRSSVHIVSSSKVVQAYEGEDAQMACVAYSPGTPYLNVSWISNEIEVTNNPSTRIIQEHFTYMKRKYTMSTLSRCHDGLPLSVADNSLFVCKAIGACEDEATIDLIVYEIPLLFQLKLRHNSAQCLTLKTTSFSKEMTSIAFDAVRAGCSDCVFGSQSVISDARIVCFNDQPDFIFYRAQVNGTRSVSVDTLIEAIQSWVETSPFISIQEELLNVVADCEVSIPSFDAPPCETSEGTEVSLSGVKPEVMSAIVLVITFVAGLIAAVVVVAILKHKATIARTEAIYKYVDSYQTYKFEEEYSKVYENTDHYKKMYQSPEDIMVTRNDAYIKVDSVSKLANSDNTMAYERSPAYENYEKIHLTACGAYDKTSVKVEVHQTTKDYEQTSNYDISPCIAYEPTKLQSADVYNEVYENIELLSDDETGEGEVIANYDALHSVRDIDDKTTCPTPSQGSEEQNLLKAENAEDALSSSDDASETTAIETNQL